jgi:alkylation response protein AidB-like acyl-CoA dehydrogenase
LNFALNDDQQVLRDSVDRFLEREYSFTARQQILQSGGFDCAMWDQMAQTGLFAAHFPVEDGGFGGGIETLIIMELFGRHQVLEPLVQCVVIAGTLLMSDPPGPARSRRLEALIAGHLRASFATLEPGMRSPYQSQLVRCLAVRDGAAWILSGAKSFADGGGAANAFLVSARDSATQQLGLFLVPADAAGLEVRTLRTIDGGTAAEITLNKVTIPATERIGAQADAGAMIEAALDRGMAAVCAEAVGAMDASLQSTIAHTRQRQQYGAPLADFQVLQHRMADMFVEVESARSMAFLSAFSIDHGGPDRAADISAARVQVGRAARFVGQQAVQLHGGMGMAEENGVAHHFKRLSMISQYFGEDSLHLRRFRTERGS